MKMSSLQLIAFIIRLILAGHYPNYIVSSNDTATRLTQRVNLHFSDCDLTTRGTACTTVDKLSFSAETCKKTWMHGSNNTCECGADIHRTVSCNNRSNQVSIVRCHCMTYDDSVKAIVVGSCPYGCGYFNDSGNNRGTYHQLPLNITNLNHGMCGRLNRDYRLCSKCVDDYTPLVYSYDLKCVKCSSKYNWLKYVAVAYIPLTFFYFIVVLFRIDATEPYLYGFVTLNQGLASPTSMRAILISLTRGYALAIRIIAVPYTIWNLDFFRSLPLNICLDLTTLQTLALDYAIALYPLLLVVITYTVIELHDWGCIVLVWLWRPFHRCCVRFTQLMDIKSSIIKAFATFFLLSYVKFINTTVDILLPTKVYNDSGKTVGLYVYYDASYKYFSHKHLPFCTLSIGFFVLFVLSPLTLLFLYPMSCFQRFLNRCRLRSHMLQAFVDAFQGHYKDGSESGTRDCRWFAAVYFLGRIVILNVVFLITQDVLCYALAGIFILVILLAMSILQPYRSSKLNNYHISLQLILAMVAFLTAILDQARVKDHWIVTPVLVSIGIILILPILILIFYIAFKLYQKIQAALPIILKMQCYVKVQELEKILT